MPEQDEPAPAFLEQVERDQSERVVEEVRRDVEKEDASGRQPQLTDPECRLCGAGHDLPALARACASASNGSTTQSWRLLWRRTGVNMPSSCQGAVGTSPPPSMAFTLSCAPATAAAGLLSTAAATT